MKLVKKDWFSFLNLPNVCCLWTGNMTITKSGKAVMGAGLAKQLALKYPDVRSSISKVIQDRTNVLESKLDKYGNKCNIHVPTLLFINRRLGMFPVKYGWWEDAKPGIIRHMCKALEEIAAKNPDYTFVLNFPGIGAGHLKFDDVFKILKEELPSNNVTIVYK